MRSLILHAVLTGPNSWKVAIVLEELSIPYQIESHSLAEIKEKAFTDRNSNGRVPVLEDPNTGVTVWESGACLEYLIEAYDKDFQLSYTDLKLKFQLKSWMFFQVSGQGPYWGQAAW
ncbi:glutathione S- transferase, nitrogen catabolite repression regulator [Lambiella insularis]|nr:glutathione S- transferase, nitrogen catabolite repression regulator [Lambiella insularis]